MIISSAGIIAELVIAAIATFIWFHTADGMVRDVCVTVMVVCSVTTVLFNGNPLLRYDGYYVLSDMVRIPNLATESANRIRGWLRSVLWGEPVADWNRAGLTGRTLFIVGYGFASGIYRIVVLIFIFAMLMRLAQAVQLDTCLLYTSDAADE